jgi:toxin ParE1/3/4
MKYQVLMVPEAEEDVWDIYRFILANDSQKSADYVLDKIQDVCQSLVELPRIGHIPPELERVGVLDYLEIHFKPYRIVYQIEGKKVFIYCVLDGRRDMQELLERRMIR